MPRKAAAKTPALKPSRTRKAPPTPPTDNAASDAERQTEYAKPDATAPASAAAPRPEGKLATLTTLLRRVQGATLDRTHRRHRLASHSVRGAISGALKKKQGLEIASVKADGVRTYRIAPVTVAENDPVTQAVRALEALPLDGLRAEWRRRFGAPPKLRSPDILRRMLAWRIQTDAWGGFDEPTRRRLRETATPKGGTTLVVGAQVTREWQGVVHTVQVGDGGFVYAGETYSSLSVIASKITGVSWNGPRFFGLRKGVKP